MSILDAFKRRLPAGAGFETLRLHVDLRTNQSQEFTLLASWHEARFRKFQAFQLPQIQGSRINLREPNITKINKCQEPELLPFSPSHLQIQSTKTPRIHKTLFTSKILTNFSNGSETTPISSA